MSIRTINVKVTGYRVSTSSDVAGAVGGYKPALLVFDFNDEWNDAAISLYFTDARGRNPVIKLLGPADINSEGFYQYEIPAEPLQQAGQMSLTIRGVIAEGTVTEKILMTSEIKFRVHGNSYNAEGAEAALPAIPLVDQIQVALETATAQISSHLSGTGSKHTAEAISYSGVLERVSNLRQAIDALAEYVGAASERPIRMKKMMLYYGYPIAIHGAWSINGAVGVYQAYDIIVFGNQYNDPEHEEHDNTVAIMAELKRIKPGIELFGYVPVGNNAPTSLTDEEILLRIEWWDSMGVDGVFLDEFGYDYLVTRERQNLCVSYLHDRGLKAFVNSWNDAYVFSNTLKTVEWLPDFEPNPDELPSMLNENDYSLYENLFWSAEMISFVLTGNTVGSKIWDLHRPYNYRYAAQDEFGGKSYAQQYGTQIICLDGFHSSLDEATRKKMETISIFACKILNINGVGFGDQYWGANGQIVDWDLPNFDLNERTIHEVTFVTKTIGEAAIPKTYKAFVNGVEFEATFDVDSIADTEYTSAKRFVLVNGVPLVDAWDTLFAMRDKVDGFESELSTVVGEIQALVAGVEDDIEALGNLTALQTELAALKTTLETTNSTVTQDVEDAIASLALIVSGFQYTLREW